MRRWVRAAQAVLIAAVVVVVPPMAKQNVTVKLWYNDQWNTHTSDLYSETSITINHAVLDGQSGLAPSDAALVWKNSDGKMSPDNRKSPLFGLIGHGTPIEISYPGDIRFSGRIVSWLPGRSLGGDRFKAWVESKAAGTLQRLGEGEPPVESAIYQTITRAIGVNPAEYWPLEAGRLVFSSATGGGALVPSFFDAAILSQDPTFKGFPGSQPSVELPAVDSATVVTFPVAAYADTGTWTVQTGWVYTRDMLPDGTATLDAVLSNGRTVHLFLDGDAAEPVSFAAAVTDEAFTVFYSDDEAISGPSILDQPLSAMVSLNSAAGGTLVLRLLDGTGSIRAELSTTGVGYGTVTRFEMSNIPRVTLPAGPLGVSHLVFYTNPAFDVDVDTVTIARATGGFPGESAADRFNRWCAQEGIAATIVGDASNTQLMGPQYPDTPLGTLGEIARTEAGIIHDTRTQEGLTLRTGRSLLNQ